MKGLSGREVTHRREVAGTEIMKDPPLRLQFTKLPKTIDGQTTMTVTVPQDSNMQKVQSHNEPLALNDTIEEGAEEIKTHLGVLPPQSV